MELKWWPKLPLRIQDSNQRGFLKKEGLRRNRVKKNSEKERRNRESEGMFFYIFFLSLMYYSCYNYWNI